MFTCFYFVPFVEKNIKIDGICGTINLSQRSIVLICQLSNNTIGAVNDFNTRHTIWSYLYHNMESHDCDPSPAFMPCLVSSPMTISQMQLNESAYHQKVYLILVNSLKNKIKHRDILQMFRSVHLDDYILHMCRVVKKPIGKSSDWLVSRETFTDTCHKSSPQMAIS